MALDDTPSLRALDGPETYALRPGDDNFRSYVGPPAQYDVMGATQFALLCNLGLRETQKVLDFGCGSLRAGRLLIPYLLKGHYHGLEPNAWLVEDAIQRHLGRDLIALKSPKFSAASDFNIDGFAERFDFIVAQSIFSHTGRDLVEKGLAGFARNLAEDGLILATFIEPERLGHSGDFSGSGWIYPDCVCFTPPTVARFFRDAGLDPVKLAWFHPRQTWYAAARSEAALERARELAENPGFKFG